MGVVKTRGATRKLGPVGLGRKVVSFKTNDCDRHFTVHEDLVCSSSKFFKQRLQKDRKAVEGECSICHEELDPKVDDVTFCRAMCGQNIHEKCMEQWKASQTGRATCPMCRKYWKHKTNDLVDLQENLDRDAVQLYIDWLYSGKLHIDEEHDLDDDKFNICLLKAWAVSHTLEDSQFTHAIVARIVSSRENEGTTGFGSNAISYAYDEGTSIMQTFVVDEYLASAMVEFFPEDMDFYPAEFTQDLCTAALDALRSMKDKPTRKELLEKWTEGEYELVEDTEDTDAGL